MNDNPFETPNPLNSAEPNNVQPAVPTSPMPQPIEQPIVSAEPKPIISTEPTNPMGGAMPTMQAASLGTESPVKPKKAGLIVGIIAAAVVFVGAIAAVSVLLLNSNSGDRFSEAIAKILNGNTPEKVEINGSLKINLAEGSRLETLSDINLEINSKMNLSNFENSSSIKLSLIAAGQTGEASLEEIYVADKGLYAKINSLDFFGSELPEQAINKWIHVSDIPESFSSLSADTTTKIISCISDNFSKIDLAKFYKANAFLTSSQKDITIERKNNPIYRIDIDHEKLASFMTSLISTKETKDIIFGCTEQVVNNSHITSEENRVYEIKADDLKTTIPSSFYVEINSNNDITRFYLKDSVAGVGVNYEVDFSFESLNALDIIAPIDAVSLEEILLGDLQDSQRDTQRRNDIALVDTALVQYQTDNTGNLPNSDDTITSASVWQAGVSGSSNCDGNEACNFVQKYLNTRSETTFADPDGTPYSVVITCNWANPNCNKGVANGTSELAPTGDEDGAYTIKDANGGLAFDAHTIYIVPGGRCNDNGAIESIKRHAAVLYQLENAGVYCVDNQ